VRWRLAGELVNHLRRRAAESLVLDERLLDLPVVLQQICIVWLSAWPRVIGAV